MYSEVRWADLSAELYLRSDGMKLRKKKMLGGPGQKKGCGAEFVIGGEGIARLFRMPIFSPLSANVAQTAVGGVAQTGSGNLREPLYKSQQFLIVRQAIDSGK